MAFGPGPLRALITELNFDKFGVPVTVTRPAPDDEPIETTGIWISPLTLDRPSDSEFHARERQYILALRRDEVPTVPRGTLIDAPEHLGQMAQRWRVDGLERTDAEQHRVSVVPDPDGT